jgi:hypothetical protein
MEGKQVEARYVMKSLILVLAFGVPLVLNLWVWFFPDTFINFLKLGKNPRLMELPLQKELWHFIESPTYIWWPRIIFSLALLIVLIMVYSIYLS